MHLWITHVLSSRLLFAPTPAFLNSRHSRQLGHSKLCLLEDPPANERHSSLLSFHVEGQIFQGRFDSKVVKNEMSFETPSSSLESPSRRRRKTRPSAGFA